MTETFTAAHRGDGVVIAETHRDYVIGQPMAERTTYELGTVTSITRDGQVKAWWPAHASDAHRVNVPGGYAIPGRRAGLWLLPAAEFDVPGAITAARAHVWPGHESVKPFDSLEEIRAALRPYKRT